MYKVFINNKPLVIVQKGTSLNKVHFKNIEVAEAVAQLKKGKISKATVAVKDPKAEWKKFKQQHKVIKAGGGLVRNNKGEILFIFRKGKWDLPKGKIDKGELVKEAAKREVEEETGVHGLVVAEKIIATWHTYVHKGENSLKKTTWYRMTTDYKGELVPEEKEDIVAVEWVDKKHMKKVMINTYEAIKEVLAVG